MGIDITGRVGAAAVVPGRRVVIYFCQCKKSGPRRMIMGLADNTCIPCKGGVPPVEPSRVQEMLKQLEKGWQLNKEGHLERLYTFKDFAQALDFVNKVGAIAEAEGHHPDLHLAWGKCK